MDVVFLIIFQFCYTSLLIFKILMQIYENLNITKTNDKNESRQVSKSSPASQPVVFI